MVQIGVSRPERAGHTDHSAAWSVADRVKGVPGVRADDAVGGEAVVGLEGSNGEVRVDAEVTVDGHTVKLAVRRAPLPAGTIGLPPGLDGIPFLSPGATACP